MKRRWFCRVRTHGNSRHDKNLDDQARLLPNRSCIAIDRDDVRFQRLGNLLRNRFDLMFSNLGYSFALYHQPADVDPLFLEFGGDLRCFVRVRAVRADLFLADQSSHSSYVTQICQLILRQAGKRIIKRLAVFGG